MISGKNLTIAFIMSVVGMLGSFTALAGSTDVLNKTKDNDRYKDHSPILQLEILP